LPSSSTNSGADVYETSRLGRSEVEGLREVVVDAEFEPGDLVVEPVGGGEHEDGHTAAGGDDASGDLVAGGPRDVAVEDGDVGGDRFEAEAIADGFGM
jgi:hypothetical protein